MTDPLVDTNWLADRLDEVLILDVRGTWKDGGRGSEEGYLAAHIPGAVFCDFKQDLLDPIPPTGLAAVADPERFAEAAVRLGVRADRPIICYDGGSYMFAGRAWWTFRYYGHPDVRVLDGGWPAWVEEERPIRTGKETAPEGDFVPEPVPDLRVGVADVERCLEEGGLLTDHRSPGSYRGDPDKPRTGHIPGAISVPYRTLLDDSGRMLKGEALRERFEAAGADPTRKPAVASCGSGYTATVGMMAFERLGRTVPLYDGSFSEWRLDVTRPVATGDNP